MFKELMVMKALRYLLITFMISLMAVSAEAQSLAQKPEIGFQSTSSMVGSGTTLPMAVETGAYTTYDVNAPGTRSNKAGIRRGLDDDDKEITTPDDNADIDATPIGDGIGALALLACAYVLLRYVRMRKRAKQMM